MKGTSPTRERARPARHRSAKIEMWFFNLDSRGEVMDKVTTVGIDLAKSVYSLHGVDGAGRVVLRRTVRRDQTRRLSSHCLHQLIAPHCTPEHHPPCAIHAVQRIHALCQIDSHSSNLVHDFPSRI